VRIALFQPDIPQNAGTILRLAACLDVTVEIIGPAGFDMSDRALRRAGLDYIDQLRIIHHTAFADFEARRREEGRRLVLLTTRADLPYMGADYARGDILLAGRESAGVPEYVHNAAELRVGVPMKPGLRSLNVAVALAMVLGEAARQTGHFERLAQGRAEGEAG
jgi:tRNA (cytidine/uridine-2'-O-)-methyltransferase